MNSEQLASLTQSLKEEAEKWKNCFKWINKEHNQVGPDFVSDKFGLPIQSPEVQEPCWVHNRRIFLKQLPVEERNILLTGDPDTSFDPYIYVWIYSFPQIAVQNPLVQQHFQHILQFEDQFQEDLPTQIIPQIPRRRRASVQTESWKNTTASE